MLNSELLKNRINDSGLKKKFIAEQLGITYQGYYLKENGINEFTASEIQGVKKLLALTDKDVKAIFFSEKVDK